MRATLLALLLIVGCGGPSETVRVAYGDLVRPEAMCRAPAPAEVTPAQMAADHEVLERLLRRGYGGFELAGDEARWAEVFASGRAALPSEPVTPLAFRDQLLEELTFLDDNHVGLWLYADGRRTWRSTSGHHQAYVGAMRFTRDGDRWLDAEGRALVDCDHGPPQDILRPVVGDALPALAHAPIVLSREPVASITCQLAPSEGDPVEVSVPMQRLGMRGTRGPSFERLEADFPWLRLRTLFTDRRDALNRFVSSGVEHRDAPVIVLDLRRAGGGSDGFLLRFFRNLTDQTFAYWETDALESEVTLQGALTFWQCVRSFSGSSDAGGREWLDNRIARAERELDEAMNERGLFRDRNPEALRLPGVAPQRYAGRFILLIDRGCGSACETSVLLARQLEGAVIVGENTEGVMKVGELRWYQLPNSRVWISLGHRHHHDPFEGFRESYGYAPDIWLDSEDPDGDVRRLAACLADPECGEELRYR